MEQFVRRAAADARSVKTETIELAPANRHHRSLFEPGSYAAVALPTHSGGHGYYQRRVALGGLPFDNARFGVAVCTHVLDQVAEPKSLLGELNRALEAHGRLYLTSPLVVDSAGSPGAGPRPTRLGMNYLLEAAGFALHDLQAIRDSTAYAIVARKARTPAMMSLRSRGENRDLRSEAPTPKRDSDRCD